MLINYSPSPRETFIRVASEYIVEFLSESMLVGMLGGLVMILEAFHDLECVEMTLAWTHGANSAAFNLL